MLAQKPLRPCGRSGCTNLTRGAYCDKHRPKESARVSSSSRGYDFRWRKARQAYLAKHPFCVECLKAGKYVAATDVDHIVPHRGNKKLFWDSDNWQPLCHSHHSQKTRRGE